MLKMKRNQNYEVVHPCLDNINGKLYLKIFRYMFSEPTLPKFNGADKLIDKDTHWAINAMSVEASRFQSDQEKQLVEFERATELRAKYREHKNLFERFLGFFKKPEDPIKTMEAVKKYGIASEQLSGQLTSAEKGIDKLLERALAASQVKLAGQIMDHKRVIAGQIVLQKNGFDKFVSERSIVQFIKRSRKGVRLDFIRNYTQMIPMSVLEIKKKADDLQVFDNYVVMYYDPEWESWGSGNVRFEKDEQAAIEQKRRDDEEEKRKKEERKKHPFLQWQKDPILFGLINNSRKLYFVADWVTDEDDLTLEKLNLIVENATQYLEFYQHDIKEEFDHNMETLRSSLKVIEQEFHPINAEYAKD